jgi:ribose transport system substrate-binding protein
MKRISALLLAACMVWGLAACQSEPAETTPPSTEAAGDAGAGGDAPATDLSGKMLAVITPSADHGFTAESIQHCEAQVKELAGQYGFSYKFLTAAEAGEQSNHVDTVLAEGPDCVILWPITGDELRSAAQSVLDQGIPLIVYDRMIDGIDAPWIMGDNDALGEGTGEYFNTYFKDDLAAKDQINILEFKGDASSVPLQRTNGFKKTADAKFNVVQEFDTGWSQQTSMEQMESFLNTKSVEEIEALDAIFTHDDEIVFGIVEALKNYSGPATLNIKLISGVSGGEGFMNLFENSGLEGIDFMTYTFSPSMVRDAVDLGVNVLKGEQLNDSYLIPTEMVDKTNYKAYMESDLYKIRYSL